MEDRMNELVQHTEAWSCGEPVFKIQSRMLANRDEANTTLVGKLLLARRIPGATLLTALKGACAESHILSANDVRHNIYVVSFASEEDRNRVWNGHPWKLCDAMLMMKKWNGKDKPEATDFTEGETWAQIHCLPMPCLKKHMVTKFFETYVKEAVEIDQTGIDTKVWVKFLRAVVVVDVTRPLPTGFFIDDEEMMVWVCFKYEKLPNTLCYTCGNLGHVQSSFGFKEEFVLERYGEWTRAGINSPPAPTLTHNVRVAREPKSPRGSRDIERRSARRGKE